MGVSSGGGPMGGRLPGVTGGVPQRNPSNHSVLFVEDPTYLGGFQKSVMFFRLCGNYFHSPWNLTFLSFEGRASVFPSKKSIPEGTQLMVTGKLRP